MRDLLFDTPWWLLTLIGVVGAALLLWIGIQLLFPEDDAGHGGKEISHLGAAIRTILIADLVMSLDNVIAVAAAAKGSHTLLIVGLAISIPLVVFGSTLLLKVMERVPLIITVGAGLLGWVAGEMAITDPLMNDWVNTHLAYLHWVAPAGGAAVVVIVGKWLGSKRPDG